jgi:hypothetical protein
MNSIAICSNIVSFNIGVVCKPTQVHVPLLRMRAKRAHSPLNVTSMIADCYPVQDRRVNQEFLDANPPARSITQKAGQGGASHIAQVKDDKVPPARSIDCLNDGGQLLVARFCGIVRLMVKTCKRAG